MIELRNVCGGYGEEEVLHNVNLRLESGKIIVIVGPNGCGKSTLLKMLIRLLPHSAGEIRIEGIHIKELEAAALAQQVAYLPQNKIPADISVLRMVLHGRFPYLKYPRRYTEEDFTIAKRALEKMGVLHLADKNVSQLSGGLQQKVYIAMVLAQNTGSILMDEPTVYLDISHQLKLMEIARELASSGKSVVMVLHDLTQALRIADEIVVMQEGKLLMCASPEEIYKSGVIEEVFHVRMDRIQTAKGWQYFYDEVII